jgi:hypothetical protein
MPIAIATDPNSLNQGAIIAVSDLVFGTPTGNAVTITSVATEIPVMQDKEFFEIRDHPQSTNNGLYQVDDAAPAAGTTDVLKVTGANPVVDATGRAVNILATLDTAVADGDWNNASGDTVDIVSAGSNLPTLFVGSRFEVRTHATAANNGVYEALSVVTNGFNCRKLTGANPADAIAEAVDIYSQRKTVMWDTAALEALLLEQPGIVSTNVTDAVWGTPSGAVVGITSAGSNLPAVVIGQKFIVRNHITAANNGTYIVRAITTVGGNWTAEMVDQGLTPASAAAENCDFDTDPLGIDHTGANGQPIYSRMMIDWKDDNFLIKNAPFPMLTIDADAGKYLIGQDGSGNSSGWNWRDVPTFGIRTRKMVRNMGWSEVNSVGAVTRQYAGIRTLGAFEDNARDLAYFQFGTDTTVDDTVNFEFGGPVDEAILCFDATVTRAQAALSGYDFNNAGDTIDRNDGGSFITDGYKVGSRVIVANAETPADNGTYRCTVVAALTLTVENLDGSAITFSNTLDDNSATLDLDNRFEITNRLRPRDDDANGKTFGQAKLADAGDLNLSNRVFKFPLATATDLKIAATDATIDGSVPYTGMSITFHATGQSRGGLVGGPYNFGIIIAGNNGTNQEIYEFVQRQLRLTTDIDADADTAIGRTIDGLMRFVGDELQAGSTDGGLTFPTNPDGGGSGVFIDAVNAVDANNGIFYDNLGLARAKPETISVTLDFNQTLIDDTVAESDLFYDRTIRTSVSDLVVNAGGTITSAGANLPVLDVGNGAYIRLDGLAGGDAAMNGVFQVVTETSQSSWTVTRYDGAAMATTSSAAVNVDEHPINTPDAIIVDTNNLIDATTISFTATNTIGDTGSGFGIFSIGDRLRIEGAGAGTNAGKIVTVATVIAGTITTEEAIIDTQAAGSQVVLTQIASVDATVDFTFSYDFDGNVQGGRTVSTTTFVKAKAIGQDTAQYTESTVQSIVSGTPLTVPLVSQQERNFANP